MIEVITILFIISLGMIGVLSLIVQNIASQSLNKNTLIAYQLAQEGVELVRKVRDTNWNQIPPSAWDTNLASGHYYMDYTDAVPILAVAGCANCPMSSPSFAIAEEFGNLYQDADGMYLDNPGSVLPGTSFYRIITISGQAPAISVVANIFWKDRTRIYEYSLETMLYDWR